MSGIIINAKQVAANIREELKVKVNKHKEIKGRVPGVAAILVGNDPSSVSYVKGQQKTASEVGVEYKMFELPAESTEEEVISLINELNDREDVNGIIVQLPLPKHISPDNVARAIKPNKDIDCFTLDNTGKLFRGEKCLLPCTPKGIVRLIKETGIELVGKKVCVVGRSNIVGKPVALLLLAEGATVNICHSKTKDLKAETLNCDILVSAAGKANLITADMVKEGTVVIDAGVNMVDGKLKGDVDFDAVLEKASHITPVPGGVGAMTTTMLIENILEASLEYEQ
ncbi:bifunctional 5,10-methylenetetrahydrofolate dehydrogenase/5,10-methenyltetrahydrofolate cyclohydrolase [Clostridium cylindrosporum]|uniref:Bifunctional protein FolD n=1 Tax=Clostridium cylindrosporum DSM 605 TaxID=1121307 RepID=A0A0J8D5B6_CLOCY|nr:tetrahydrofolate dehydrogenase/cyclohydrolase catalytic domain-containing protein [Clostridium cylindrosporum]KMT21350.1 methylenetetrahydrofolate dehydrogenase/methenyltetrahydrofolate cyclohydrolase FolD [Clostridium cylindrosporum DSM 605]